MTSIPRREFLRHLGISAAALPFIGGLGSLYGNQGAAPRKKRLVIMFSPNGTVQEKFWPDAAGGKFKQATPPRTAAEKALSRREAALVLGALIPDLTGSVVGRANAQAAGRKLGALLNNRRLNAHLVLTLLDT
ncbi:MAG: hypothetical protein EOP87_13125, partial [Verrucomicrobiaceae bacterium]